MNRSNDLKENRWLWGEAIAESVAPLSEGPHKIQGCTSHPTAAALHIQPIVGDWGGFTLTAVATTAVFVFGSPAPC